MITVNGTTVDNINNGAITKVIAVDTANNYNTQVVFEPQTSEAVTLSVTTSGAYLTNITLSKPAPLPMYMFFYDRNETGLNGWQAYNRPYGTSSNIPSRIIKVLDAGETSLSEPINVFSVTGSNPVLTYNNAYYSNSFVGTYPEGSPYTVVFFMGHQPIRFGEYYELDYTSYWNRTITATGIYLYQMDFPVVSRSGDLIYISAPTFDWRWYPSTINSRLYFPVQWNPLNSTNPYCTAYAIRPSNASQSQINYNVGQSGGSTASPYWNPNWRNTIWYLYMFYYGYRDNPYGTGEGAENSYWTHFSQYQEVFDWIEGIMGPVPLTVTDNGSTLHFDFKGAFIS